VQGVGVGTKYGGNGRYFKRKGYGGLKRYMSRKVRVEKTGKVAYFSKGVFRYKWGTKEKVKERVKRGLGGGR